MRLLIYGAGVIGCLYAALFSKAGYDTTVYARGERLETLLEKGLLYETGGIIHKADNPKKVWKESKIMAETAKQVKANFKALYARGIKPSPGKLNLLCLLPVGILTVGFRIAFHSSFGNMFMYQHSMNAPDEMRRLHTQFYQYVNDHAEPLRQSGGHLR